MTDTPSLQCEGTTKAGTRCKAAPQRGARWCLFHDPDKADELREIRTRGQRAAVESAAVRRQERMALLEANTAGPRPPVGDSLDEIAIWLRWVLEAGATGELGRGEVVAFTAGARVLQQTIEKRDLEVEVRRLRQELARARRKGGHR